MDSLNYVFFSNRLTWCQPYFNVYDSTGECILGIDGSFAMMFFSIGRHKVVLENVSLHA